MGGLRTSPDQLRSVDPHLTDNFATINRELETVTLAISLKSNVDGRDSISDIDVVDPFGGLVVRLKPPPFESLRSASCDGPVIIINHPGWRSDIIILLHDTSPSLITTFDDFFDRANEL
jgi:hypothetical protein